MGITAIFKVDKKNLIVMRLERYKRTRWFFSPDIYKNNYWISSEPKWIHGSGSPEKRSVSLNQIIWKS